MSSTGIRQLRLLGMTEAMSFIVLLAIAMPLKYLAGIPMAVRIVGMAHGLLFISYVVCVGYTASAAGWPFRRTALTMGAALVPAGPFLVDGRLREDQRLAAQRELAASSR